MDCRGWLTYSWPAGRSRNGGGNWAAAFSVAHEVTPELRGGNYRPPSREPVALRGLEQRTDLVIVRRTPFPSFYLGNAPLIDP
jgi:hypothetical protein